LPFPEQLYGDLLAINQPFKFSHARPLHAAHRLGGFGNGSFRAMSTLATALHWRNSNR